MVARAKKRPSTMADLIRSLAVILIPLLIITALFTNVGRDAKVKTIDWQPVLATARSEAPFPVLAPTNLPPDWRPTRVSWLKPGQPTTGGNPSPGHLWQLGFLTPDEIYLDLRQADGPTDKLIDQQSRQGTADGTSSINGETWTRMVSSDGRTRALVQPSPKVTAIIAGDLPYDALDAFASTLTTTS